MTDGANLSGRGNIVVVSVNHRLNIFGFLHLADIGGSAWAHSGNAGMLDIIAALRWVHDNIEAFGGDPGNVTIFGESGGGGKVSVLLAMPAARGLFHRAIIQSGAAIRVSTRERANALAEAVLKELGVGRNECESLQTFAAERLLAAIAPAARGWSIPLAVARPLRFWSRRRWQRSAATSRRAGRTRLIGRYPVDDRRHPGGECLFPRR